MGTPIPDPASTRAPVLCLQLWVYNMDASSAPAPTTRAECGGRGGTPAGPMGFLGREEGEEVTVTGDVAGLAVLYIRESGSRADASCNLME